MLKSSDHLIERSDFLSALESDPNQVISSYDSSGNIDFISKGVTSCLGFKIDDVLGLNWFERCPFEGAVYYRAHRDGSSVRFINTFYSVSETGRVHCIDKLASGTSSSVGHSVLVDADGVIASWYNSTEAAAGLGAQFLSKKLFSVALDLYRNGILIALSKARGGKSQLNVKCVLRVPSTGTELHGAMDFHHRTDGAVVIAARLAEGESTTAVVEVPEDASDVERRLLDMQEEIQYLRDFRDNAALPMYSVDGNSKICWANDAMIDLMGYKGHREEYIGSDTLQHHVDNKLASFMLETVLDMKLLVDFPCRVKKRDGNILDVTYNSNAYFNSDRRFIYSRCIVQDITARKKLEDERDSLKEEQNRAQLGEVMAKKESDMKSSFLATMTHEIRTPINGVIGAASLLAITEMTPEQTDYVDTIVSSAEILLSLVSNILDISKIESGKLELDAVPLNVAGHIAKACSIFRTKAEEKDIEFTLDIDSALHDAWFLADPTRLNQIVLNFLSNAMKFTHSGGVRCRVADEGCSGESTAIYVEVTDTGIGIKDPSLLFSDFVQANQHISQEYGGTGLGLSISKKLVQLMEGEVGMQSKLGDGTTVWARMRLRKANKPDMCPLGGNNMSTWSRSGDLGSHAATTKQPRILIAEDNKVNQKLLKRMLETLDYSDVVVASDGLEAVIFFKEALERSAGFDLVFMDCLMPKMNGWDATREIRNLELKSGLSSRSVIIALTANALESDRQKCIACGMDEFCGKPLTRDRLIVVMLDWPSKISRRGVQPDSSEASEEQNCN